MQRLFSLWSYVSRSLILKIIQEDSTVNIVINYCYVYVFFKILNNILFLLCLYKIMYSELSPHGPLKLYHFIAMVTVVMIFLSQFPSFHSLRHINLVSLFLSLGYTFLVVGACINAGKFLCSLWFRFIFMSLEYS